jgi:hypothetical protein
VLQYLYTDNIEEKKELIKAITLGDKDKFQLTPLPQVHTSKSCRQTRECIAHHATFL